VNIKKSFVFLHILLLTSKLASEKPTYPNVICRENRTTVQVVKQVQPKVYAEFGISIGCTALEVAKILPKSSQIYLFDFHDKVENVKNKLNNAGFTNVHIYGNSYKLRDSYNWSLMELLEKHKEPIFDYVFLDGMHTWETDALAFLLIDKLLKPGGYIDFDDYNWNLATSPTLAPKVFPLTKELYTDEQIKVRSVGKILDLLVRRDTRYQEVVKNKVFRKIK